MKHTFHRCLTWCAAICLFLSGCGQVQTGSTTDTSDERPANQLTVLTIGTADSGGTMYPVGKLIAQLISETDSQIRVNVSASNGSSSNIKSIENGSIDLGLVSGDAAYSAVHGEWEFQDSPANDLRAIAAVYSSLSQWAVPSSLNLSYVHELKGHSLCVGPQDSTTELAAQIALDVMGINEENTNLQNLGIGSGAALVAKGEMDAVHGFSGIPTSGITDLTDTVPCTLLSYTETEIEKILRNNLYYYSDVIPAGTYAGQDRDIPTFGIKCLLCVNASADDDLVYHLTEILYEHTEELANSHAAMSSMLQHGFSYSMLPIALHPGAQKYYQEQGLLDISEKNQRSAADLP